MPVKFTQTTGLENHIGSCNCLGNGEVGRVNLAEHAPVAANLLGRMLQGAVHKRAIPGGDWRNRARDVLLADFGV